MLAAEDGKLFIFGMELGFHVVIDVVVCFFLLSRCLLLHYGNCRFLSRLLLLLNLFDNLFFLFASLVICLPLNDLAYSKHIATLANAD